MKPNNSIVFALTNGETLLATVDVAATPERVFQAFAMGEIERWWGAAASYRTVRLSAKLCVGGRWTAIVKTLDGKDLPANGEFIEIEAPRRMVLTRKSEWDHPSLGGRETIVAYLLEPVSTGTRVTICQGGFAGLKEAADEHAERWKRVLGWLVIHLSSEKRAAAWQAVRAHPGEGARQAHDVRPLAI